MNNEEGVGQKKGNPTKKQYAGLPNRMVNKY